MARTRMTWDKKKNASPPPAMPVETGGYEHPADQPDPGADDYKNGDTSSWAEDPHKGPYENSAHPATPDEGPFHPAQPAGKVASEEEQEAAAQQKAARVIRIAQHLLGPKAAYSDVEAQAFGFMHMPDAHIAQTLSRLAGKKGEDEEEEMEDEDEGKKASVHTAAFGKRLSTIERVVKALAKKAGVKSADWMDEDDMLSEMMGDEASGHMSDDAMLSEMMAEEAEPEMMGDDALLAEMMADQTGGHFASEEKKAESMLREMLAAAKGAEDDEEEDGKKAADEEEEEEGSKKEASLDIDLGVTQTFDGIELTAGSLDQPAMTENDSVLAHLFSDDMAKYAGDDEEEEEEEEAGDEGKQAALDDELMAALRPQAKKASNGATAIGNVKGGGRDKQAAEINELTGLWNAPPDVSEHFSSNNF